MLWETNFSTQVDRAWISLGVEGLGGGGRARRL